MGVRPTASQQHREIREKLRAERQAEADRLTAEREAAQKAAEERQAARTARALGPLFNPDDPRVPVHLGNLLGPEGNVFNVIGAVRSALVWASEKWPHGVTREQCQVVDEYRQRKYEETLDLIEAYFQDLDGSISAYRDAMSAPDDGPPRFGDNPLGGFFG